MSTGCARPAAGCCPLYDIHSNLPALEAVLDDAEAGAPREVVCIAAEAGLGLVSRDLVRHAAGGCSRLTERFYRAGMAPHDQLKVLNDLASPTFDKQPQNS